MKSPKNLIGIFDRNFSFISITHTQTDLLEFLVFASGLNGNIMFDLDGEISSFGGKRVTIYWKFAIYGDEESRIKGTVFVGSE